MIRHYTLQLNNNKYVRSTIQPARFSIYQSVIEKYEGNYSALLSNKIPRPSIRYTTNPSIQLPPLPLYYPWPTMHFATLPTYQLAIVSPIYSTKPLVAAHLTPIQPTY